MKTKLLVAILGVAAFLTTASYALDTYFQVLHNTGTAVVVYAVGEFSDVGGTVPCSGVPTAPASALWAPFFNPNNGMVDIRAEVDSTYSTGFYYIGYFPGGGDCYLNIYN